MNKINLLKPYPLQREILNDPARYKIIICGRRFGKDLAIETPLMTVNRGWITVGDVKVGDVLIGSNGKPTNVIYVPPIENREVIRFSFSTGEDIIAGRTHDWVTYSDKRKSKLTSEEIIDSWLDVHKIPKNDGGWIYFTDYEELPTKQLTRCIGVDAPDHLFCVGKTMILTHNTELGKIAIAETVIRHQEQAFWFSPTYQMSMEIWRDLITAFQPIIKRKNEQSKILDFYGGGQLRVFSGENFDSVRGLKPYLIVFDEAAMMINPDIWYAACRPALGDKYGKALFLTTPRGRNWIYDLYMKGIEGEGGYKSWTAPSWVNPFHPKSEILQAKIDYTESLFAQEYEGKFLLDASTVFSGVSLVCTAPYLQPYDGNFSMGVDLARKNDFTVISVFDIDSRKMVDLIRIGSMDWHIQRQKIKEVYEQWKPRHCWVEENNVGDVICQDLTRMGLRVLPYYTHKNNKPELIQKFAMGIKNQQVELLNDRDLLIEFQAYEMNLTKAGNLSYGAPSGFHDDIVMSCAMAYQGLWSDFAVKGGGLRRHPSWNRRRKIR